MGGNCDRLDLGFQCLEKLDLVVVAREVVEPLQEHVGHAVGPYQHLIVMRLVRVRITRGATTVLTTWTVVMAVLL